MGQLGMMTIDKIMSFSSSFCNVVSTESELSYQLSAQKWVLWMIQSKLFSLKERHPIKREIRPGDRPDAGMLGPILLTSCVAVQSILANGGAAFTGKLEYLWYGWKASDSVILMD